LEQVHGEAPRVLKSHVEVGESSRTKPRVTTRILLNKWQSRRKNATRGEDTRRRGAGLRKKRAGKSWNNTRGNKSVHIGVRILQTLLE
jgi:hypothetical protein